MACCALVDAGALSISDMGVMNTGGGGPGGNSASSMPGGDPDHCRNQRT